MIRRNHQTGQVSLDPLRWPHPVLVRGPLTGRGQSRATADGVNAVVVCRSRYAMSALALESP